MQMEGDDAGLMVVDDEGEEGDDEEETVVNTAENHREISWIWTVAGTPGSDAELEEALRIEWAKAWSWSRRWTKEVGLLEEEYSRVLLSFEHKALLWIARAKSVPIGVVPVEVAQGAITCAIQKADMFRTLAVQVRTAWTEVHHGWGKKRTMCVPVPEYEGVEGGVEGGVGGGEADDLSNKSEDETGLVHSDEEHFLGSDDDFD
jgi:hypothetical protein